MRRRRLAVTALLALAAGAAAGCAGSTGPGQPRETATARARVSAHAATSARVAVPGRSVGSSAVPDPKIGGGAVPDADDPARFAAQVRRYAAPAGIDPRLLMAILYNESYKPHDPALQRAWQRLDPNASLGIANMHRAAFDDTKRGRDFADRGWDELPDDPGLAVEAAAWYLHDLADQLPASWPGRYTRDELLALGYNAGPDSMKAFAGGGTPGPVAQSYLDRLHANWDTAARALK